jgi:hypothetical protein
LIQFDSALIVAFHLCLIGVLQHFPRARKGFLARRHDETIVASGSARVISTMVQRVCYVEPVLYAGKSRQKYTALYDIPPSASVPSANSAVSSLVAVALGAPVSVVAATLRRHLSSSLTPTHAPNLRAPLRPLRLCVILSLLFCLPCTAQTLEIRAQNMENRPACEA